MNIMEKLIKEIPSPRSSYLDHTLSCLRQELGILRRALLPFTDKDNIFYFLDSKKKGEYGIFEEKNQEGRYSFKLDDKDLGFFIAHIETKKFKGLKIN